MPPKQKTVPIASEGVRDSARKMLSDRLDANQLDKLFDEVLAITKQAWGNCKECKHRVLVEIPDARGVVGALSDLVTKIADIPKEEETGGPKIVFQRLVEMPEDE